MEEEDIRPDIDGDSYRTKMIRFFPQHTGPDTIDRVLQNSPDDEMALDRYYNNRLILFRTI